MHPLYDIYKKVLDIPVRETEAKWLYEESFFDESSTQKPQPLKKELEWQYKAYYKFRMKSVHRSGNYYYIPMKALAKYRAELLTIKDNPPRDLEAIKSEGIIISEHDTICILGYMRGVFLYIYDEMKRENTDKRGNSMTGSLYYKNHVRAIDKLIPLFDLLCDFAKITPKNKAIIMQGVRTYVAAQHEEIGDTNFEDDFTLFMTENALMYANSFTIKFYEMCRKLMKNTKETHFQKHKDLFPKAPGKDDTNEIEHGANPMQDDERKINPSTAKNMQTLDTMRNRHAKYKAGGSEYDYCYSELGFDVELTKTGQIDITRDLAHRAISTQIVKGNVLLLAESFFYKEYKKKIGWSDHLVVDKHIVSDMKEAEINKALQDFNAYSMAKAVKSNLSRYEQGYYPQIQKPTQLNLIDESIERIYENYIHFYTQLNVEGKKKFSFIEEENGKYLQTMDIYMQVGGVYAHHDSYYMDYLRWYSDRYDMWDGGSDRQRTNYLPKKIPLKDIDLETHYEKLKTLPFSYNFETIRERAYENFTAKRKMGKIKRFYGTYSREKLRHEDDLLYYMDLGHKESKEVNLTNGSVYFTVGTNIGYNAIIYPELNPQYNAQPCKVLSREVVFSFLTAYNKPDLITEIDRIKKYLSDEMKEMFKDLPPSKSDKNLDIILRDELL